MTSRNPRDDCPCGSGKLLHDCCGLCHAGVAAPTAEALMRSRYSAYVLGLDAYLLTSWHPSTRPPSLDLHGDSAKTKWLGLKVLRSQTDADRAIVEFVARYKIGGASAVRMHETSRFVSEDGHWFYVDGDVRES